jgi:hypothetical protein
MDERYVSITVLSDPVAADQACSVLEEAGMPVLIQHLEVEDGAVKVSGYRVLAPANCAQTAMKLLNLRRPSGAGLAREAA